MMPQVKMCEVAECFFNQSKMCRANAINVGASHPQCDTYTPMEQHAAPAQIGQVGACKVAHCAYNNNLSCSAPGIVVGHHETHADCQTFTPK